MKAGEVEAHGLERPARRPIAAGHPAPDILMEIDKDVETVFARHFADASKVIEIGGIELVRPGVGYRFPCRQQAQAVETPMTQALKMLRRIGQRKRPADKRNRTMIQKIRRKIGTAARRGHFAIPAKINTTQDYAAAIPVHEPASVDTQFA